MKRKRRSTSGTSLELLLDTICNTFGGVLFLTVLIAMLVQSQQADRAHQPPSAADQAALVRLESEHANLVSQQTALIEASELQKSVAQAIDDPQRAASIDELRRLEGESDRLNQQRQAVTADLANHQEAINRTAQDLADLRSELANARAQQKRLDTKVDKELKSRAQIARLPTLRATAKRERVFCVKGGKFYVLTPPGTSFASGLNEAEFEITRLKVTTGVSPRDDAGLRIRDSVTGQAAMRRIIDAYAPAKDYLAIFVWPDSYGEFQLVKKAALTNGFAYRLVPLPEGVSTLWTGAGNVQVMQ